MNCGACGTENTLGAKLCSECGATLARACLSCSAPLAAGAAFRDVGEPFWLATALLEQAGWLAAHSRGEETAPLLTKAREVFDRLRAQPRLERLDAVQVKSSTATPTST